MAAVRQLGRPREAELLVMARDHGVLGGGQVFADQGDPVQRTRLICQQRQCRLLDAAAEHPAGHQPGVDAALPRRIHMADDDGDDAVVAEPVDQADLQAERLRIGHDRQHLLLGAATGGQVELVGLVDELDDPAEADAVEPAPDQLHLQRAQITRQVGGRGAHRRRALGIGRIVRGAGAVLVGDRDALEIATSGQDAGHQRGIVVGDLRHRDFRQFAAYQVALERVIVEEHQAVDADVQLAGDPAQVGRLVVPVGDEAGDVGAAQQHLGMLVERQPRIGLVVLRADREDHAALGQ